MGFHYNVGNAEKALMGFHYHVGNAEKAIMGFIMLVMQKRSPWDFIVMLVV